MSKTNVRGNLTLWKPDIAASKQRGLRYILGYVNKIGPLRIVTDVIVFSRETGSIACHGAPGVSNTAGASLWVSDYALQAASLGIEETFFHEGIGYKYNFVSILSSLSPIISLACSMVSFTVPTNQLKQVNPRRVSFKPSSATTRYGKLLRRNPCEQLYR